MKRYMDIIRRLLRPGVALIVLLTIFSLTAMIFVFVNNRETTVVGYISHAFFAYTLTVLIINMPTIAANARSFVNDSRISSAIYKNKYGRLYMTDKAYRTKIALYTSLSMTLIYAALKLLAGIHYASFWYGADAIFYVVLSTVQVLMLRHIRKNKDSMEDQHRQYRFCGYFLFVLNAALIGVVFQIVHQNMGYQYPGILIYIVAAYTFLCLAVAIVNVFSYRKLNSPALSAVRAIRLAKAFVAIFALQTALLTSFSGDDFAPYVRLTNTLTGGGVCLLIFGMALYMVKRANKNLQKLTINSLEIQLKQNKNVR